MPSWSDLRRFCKKDGWEMYKRGRDDHYRKIMPDGTIKFTRVSRGTGEIGYHQWREILNKQLQVDQEYFNRLK